ncbi:hypothetical protein F7734_53580 [Scytonema sp. UIC 10036]|uniref:hypothetical protein n=1 Tax=Scytonema sp. UIC 10036 TaxID=2304196 RepID=UPI0012DAC69A|nr:hypothetical protein [Scytonema sp. UIC 10036]MUH00640.1 hypothetical protein [Scytonema sp. UIC 10036]
MLNCNLLEVGKRYLYKGKFFIFQAKLNDLYIFTDRGVRKELSAEEVRRNVWEEIKINTASFEAFNE